MLIHIQVDSYVPHMSFYTGELTGRADILEKLPTHKQRMS